jgi:hypothetical protein
MLSHLRLQRVKLRLLIGRQQTTNLGLRCLVDIHHLRPLIRFGSGGVLMQRLHLLPRVLIDSLHLRHLVRRQIQLLGQEVNLVPSHSAMSWTALPLWWRRRFLCHRRQHAQRGRPYRQNSYSKYKTTKHRHLHRILTLFHRVAGALISGGQAIRTDAPFPQRTSRPKKNPINRHIPRSTWKQYGSPCAAA